jgi:hypothetical protein
MQKIITFSVQDIVVSPEQVAEALTHACLKRRGRYRVSGLAQLGDQVYFVLVSAGRGFARERYILATVEDISTDGFPEALLHRWSNGCNLIGLVVHAGGHQALYAQPERDDA